MANYPTPHINARPSDFAKTVLMPGDPLRAKFIAETYLTDPVCINEIGAFWASREHTGMCPSPLWPPAWGCPPSAFTAMSFFISSAWKISCASAPPGPSGGRARRDLVIGMGASTNSNYAHQFNLPGTLAPSRTLPCCGSLWSAPRPWASPPMWAIFCPATPSTATTRRPTSAGGAWGSSAWRWRPPPFT